jgi:hypothetical protein
MLDVIVVLVFFLALAFFFINYLDGYVAFLIAKTSKAANTAGYTVTGTFEHFMQGCIEANGIILPEVQTANFEVEAPVLVDWISKDKRFTGGEKGEEVNVQGRLFLLIPKVHDVELLTQIQKALEKSVA